MTVAPNARNPIPSQALYCALLVTGSVPPCIVADCVSAGDQCQCGPFSVFPVSTWKVEIHSVPTPSGDLLFVAGADGAWLWYVASSHQVSWACADLRLHESADVDSDSRLSCP